MLSDLTHDSDAEEAVLGALLIDGEQIHQLDLSPMDFYNSERSTIYAACQSLAKEHTPINTITLAHELRDLNALDKVGGAGYLVHLEAIVPTSLDAPAYACIVKNLSIRRQVEDVGRQITALSSRPPGEVLSEVHNLLAAIQQKAGGLKIMTPHARAEYLIARYAGLSMGRPIGISTGLRKLDEALGGGLFPGEVTLIGARASMGKTTFLQWLFNQVAQSHKVLFVSREMTVDGISDRDIAALTGHSVGEIRRGSYTENLHTAVMQAVQSIADRQVYLYRNRRITTEQVYEAALTTQEIHGLDLLAIDYLGLLDNRHGRSEYERVSEISRQIKGIAEDLNVPVLVAAQLNRQPEGREDKRPQLKDLRDSGQLEADADNIIMLYRDSYYDHQLYEHETTELTVWKARQGTPGVVYVEYDKAHQSFKPGVEPKE